MRRSITLDAAGRLNISTYGTSWICEHRVWLATDGVVMLRVPLDVALVVTDLQTPQDLDVADAQRVQSAVVGGITAAVPAGYRVVAGSGHRCVTTETYLIAIACLAPA